jgi:hypothetical protein
MPGQKKRKLVFEDQRDDKEPRAQTQASCCRSASANRKKPVSMSSLSASATLIATGAGYATFGLALVVIFDRLRDACVPRPASAY